MFIVLTETLKWRCNFLLDTNLDRGSGEQIGSRNILNIGIKNIEKIETLKLYNGGNHGNDVGQLITP